MPRAPASSDSAPRLAVVNGLRGVAILAVLYFHFVSDRLTPVVGAPGFFVGAYLVSPYSLIANGWVGVNLFFVLSGFVLALPYMHGERDLRTRSDLTSFYARRARRLFPLYYLCLFVALLVETRGADFVTSPAEVLSLMTFAFAFQPVHFLPRINAPLWSLGVEFWFSMAFPLLLVAMRRAGVAAVTAAALVVSCAFRFYYAQAFTGLAVYLLPIKDGPFGRLDDFVVGIALCHLYVRRGALSPALATTAVLSGVAIVFLGDVAWDNIIGRRLPFAFCTVLNDVTLLGFALVLFGLLGNAPRLFLALFTNPPLQVAGMMCYSIYLWHLLGVHTFEDPPLSTPDVARRLALTFLVSAVTYRFVEFPTKTWRALFVPSDSLHPPQGSTRKI